MNENTKDQRFLDRISGMFHKIFETSHLIYTIIFIIIILIISFLSFSENLGDFSLFIATMCALMYLILMIAGISSRTDDYLFSKEPQNYSRKIFAVIITLGISFILIIFYFLFGRSTQITVQFLGWDILLPAVFVIIYFGWNLVQIFFIRISFENIAQKVNDKLIEESLNSSRNKNLNIVFVITVIILTFLIQIGSQFGFLSLFEPETPSGSLLPLYWFYGWNVFMYVLIVVLSYRLYQLYVLSKKNGTPNVFSSVFHILVWIIIWYRSFSFIYAFQSVETSLGIDAMRIFTDILLMILTSLLTLRGLGAKVYKYRIFNPNNLPFFLFAFTILYVEGQVIMIIGAGSITGIYTSRGQINLVNNFLILVVTFIFYWWYSKVTLERRNLIFKSSFNHKEVFQIVNDFKDYLENTGAIERNKIRQNEITTFLRNKNITVKDKTSKNKALE